MKTKYIIGIDEVGRGPIAGPVAVGGCMVNKIDIKYIKTELLTLYMNGKLKDSKKLSEAKRIDIYKWMCKQRLQNKLNFFVSIRSSKTIDKIGIVPSIKRSISTVITKLTTIGNVGSQQFCRNNAIVFLDGGLSAPKHCMNQKTIIKGDEKEMMIALASIVAKVTRDEYMKRLDKRLNLQGIDYDFTHNKGYGTRKHYEAIAKYGLSKEHRTSFCRDIVSP